MSGQDSSRPIEPARLPKFSSRTTPWIGHIVKKIRNAMFICDRTESDGKKEARLIVNLRTARRKKGKRDGKTTDLPAKAAKNHNWDDIAAHLGMSPVWTASAYFGMNSMKEDQARALTDFLGLEQSVIPILMQCPTKTWDSSIPQDPLIYRFYEIVGVYGETLKSVIQEKFGDGIMSAIDFSMDVQKIEDPKGDRVVVTLNGKFLPYKSW